MVTLARLAVRRADNDVSAFAALIARTLENDSRALVDLTLFDPARHTISLRVPLDSDRSL
jgi:hypothetical protein